MPRRDESNDDVTANAADAGQVKEARRRERDQLKQETDDLRWLLDQPQFRRFVWRYLGWCRVFESIFEQSSKIYFNAGVQDVGHKLMAEVTAASPEAFLQMMQENKEKRA